MADTISFEIDVFKSNKFSRQHIAANRISNQGSEYNITQTALTYDAGSKPSFTIPLIEKLFYMVTTKPLKVVLTQGGGPRTIYVDSVFLMTVKDGMDITNLTVSNESTEVADEATVSYIWR